MDEGNWIEPIGVVVTALATMVLAYFTFVLARHTKRLADVEEHPIIVATIEPSRRSINWLDISIENVCTAVAYDIALEFRPALIISGQTRKESPIERISILKPDQVVSSSLASWAQLETKSFTVGITWKKWPDSHERENFSYNINLNYLEGLSRLGGDPEIEMAEATKKIADGIGQIVRGYAKLSVNTFDSEDREAEQREVEQWREERRTQPATNED